MKMMKFICQTTAACNEVKKNKNFIQNAMCYAETLNLGLGFALVASRLT